MSGCCGSKPKIHRQMTIDQILEGFPSHSAQLSKEITRSGLHCVGCHAATWETLEAGMRGHGMAETAIDELVHNLNHILKLPPEISMRGSAGVTLTPTAAKYFQMILQEEGKSQDCALRFGDESSGCSGSKYVLDFSEKAEKDDVVMESHGVKIHINQSMLGRLNGTVIDYIEKAPQPGFKVVNPNQKGSCGCGTSHSY